MGFFSWHCKCSDEPVCFDGINGDDVYLFLLKDGKVLEQMRGNYDGYGRVQIPGSRWAAFEWNMKWNKVCDLMANDNKGDGIATVLARHYKGKVPETVSRSHEEQGFGKVVISKVKCPSHTIFKR